MLGLIGLILALVVFAFCMYKNVSVYLSALAAIAIVAVCNGLNFNEATGAYMAGMGGYLQGYFLMMWTGAVFGKVAEVSGAAESLGMWFVRRLGKKAILGIILFTTVTTMANLSAFVALFAILPIVLTVFKNFDYPRRFVPATLLAGSLTVGMVVPGSVQVHNLIPGNAVGMGLMAGATVGYINAVIEIVLCWAFIMWMIKRAQKNGEHFAAKTGDIFASAEDENTADRPPVLLAVIPFIVVVVLCNMTAILGIEIWEGIAISTILEIVLWHKWYSPRRFIEDVRAATPAGINITLTMGVVYGFGRVVSSTEAFAMISEAVLRVPGNPLISAAVATNVMAGVVGSASSALNIVVPNLTETYLAMGVVPAALARVFTVTCVCMDSLPHNGAICSLLEACKEDHKSSYLSLVPVTIIVPLIGTMLCIILFAIFPNLP